MNYEPRIGEIGLVKTSGTFARLINIGTQSRWNHSIIYVGHRYCDQDCFLYNCRGKIVEANPKGVQLSSVEKYPLVAWSKHIKFTKKQGETAADHAISLIGRPYNFFDIGQLVFRILGAKFIAKVFLTKMGSNTYGYICSELSTESWNKALIPFIVKAAELVSPGDQAEFFVYN